MSTQAIHVYVKFPPCVITLECKSAVRQFLLECLRRNKRGTEVSYLRVLGSPSLPPRHARSPPLSSPSFPFSSAARARSCWRNPTRRGAARPDACPSACLPACLPEGERALPRRSARFSFNSSSVAVGLDSSDLSLYSVSV